MVERDRIAEESMRGEIEMSDLFLDCLEKSDSDCRVFQEDTTSRLRVSDEQSCTGSSPLERPVPPRQGRIGNRTRRNLTTEREKGKKGPVRTLDNWRGQSFSIGIDLDSVAEHRIERCSFFRHITNLLEQTSSPQHYICDGARRDMSLRSRG